MEMVRGEANAGSERSGAGGATASTSPLVHWDSYPGKSGVKM